MMLGFPAPPEPEITALQAASEGKFAACKAALKRNPTEAGMIGSGGFTPIFPACQLKRDDILELLLQHGADPLVRECSGATALHFAVNRNALPCVRLLLRAGANVNAQCQCGESPLHRAAEYGWVECVRALLDEGADPNLRDAQGESPLVWAKDWHEWQSEDVKARKKRCAELLREGGAQAVPGHVPLPIALPTLRNPV